MTRENLPHPADVESCLQITGHVDVSLRDRIAAAVEQNLAKQLPSDLPDRYYEWIGYDTLADAVIAALGLRQDYDPYSEPESSRHRYVTDWVPD